MTETTLPSSLNTDPYWWEAAPLSEPAAEADKMAARAKAIRDKRAP